MSATSRLGRFEYEESSRIYGEDHSFYALIAAAMRKADSENAALLRAAFPAVWGDLQARYDAPGGLIDGESS